MVSYDNSGKKISEINVIVWPEGGTITTRDNQGNVNTREVFGAKLIP